jgi:hypothetical protein
MILRKPIQFCFFSTLLLLSGVVHAQDKEGAYFKFEEDTYDFGDIQQGKKVEHTFNFKNTGNQPLVISNIITTCGCTAPTWPKDPVLPGKKGEIKVIFNSVGKIGKQNKIITILSNSANGRDRITIQANVIPGS